MVSIVVLGALMGLKLYLSYYSTTQSAQVALANQYIGIATDIAEGLDKELYQHVLHNRETDQAYTAVRLYLERYRYRIHALYVYTLALDTNDKAEVIVAASPAGKQQVAIGSPCLVPVKSVKLAQNGGSYYTRLLDDDTNGTYMSVGVPFYNEAQELMGILAIDIEASRLAHISNQVVNGTRIPFITDLLFAVLLLVVVFLLRKWYKLRLRQDRKQTEELYMTELAQVIDAIKSGRHDFMNHLQVLNGLFSMRLYDKAGDYLKELTFKSKALQLSLKMQNPVLLVLFQSKWEQAQLRGVELQFDTDMEDYSRVDSVDLVKLFANLLDNAIEAVELYGGARPRRIRVICKTVGGKYILAVENPAELTPAEQRSFFKNGYTSKARGSFSHPMPRGNGLTIIKRTADRYKGDVIFQYDEGVVLIQVVI
jgi:sensor histidine kinase regulating citrate/malate metabolism